MSNVRKAAKLVPATSLLLWMSTLRSVSCAWCVSWCLVSFLTDFADPTRWQAAPTQTPWCSGCWATECSAGLETVHTSSCSLLVSLWLCFRLTFLSLSVTFSFVVPLACLSLFLLHKNPFELFIKSKLRVRISRPQAHGCSVKEKWLCRKIWSCFDQKARQWGTTTKKNDKKILECRMLNSRTTKSVFSSILWRKPIAQKTERPSL